jgi:hypothetical protein
MCLNPGEKRKFDLFTKLLLIKGSLKNSSNKVFQIEIREDKSLFDYYLDEKYNFQLWSDQIPSMVHFDQSKEYPFKEELFVPTVQSA